MTIPAIDSQGHYSNATDFPVWRFVKYSPKADGFHKLASLALMASQFAPKARGPACAPTREEAVRGGLELLRARAGEQDEILDGFEFDESAGSIVDWVLLLLRSRKRVVERRQEVDDAVFVDLIVDLDGWFPGGGDARASVDDYIKAIGRRTYREAASGKITHFVPFNPAYPDALARVQKAWMDWPFRGIKIYPAAGFRPSGNVGVDGIPPIQLFQDAPFTAAELDQRLWKLYEWCNDDGIIITAHCSPKGAEAMPGLGHRSNPYYWRAVLERYPALRLHLAHFGAVRDDVPDHPLPEEPLWSDGRIVDATPDQVEASAEIDWDQLVPTENWAIQISRLADRFDNVYTDTAYHQVFPRRGTGKEGQPSFEDIANRREAYVRGLNALLAAYPKLRKRLMYGSDWHMTVASESDMDFLPNFAELSNQLDLDPYDFFVGNAARFLPDDAFGVPIPDKAEWEDAYRSTGEVVIPRKG